MKSNKHLIINDTNILNVQYNKKADFTKFNFNSVLDKIEATLKVFFDVNNDSQIVDMYEAFLEVIIAGGIECFVKTRTFRGR